MVSTEVGVVTPDAKDRINAGSIRALPKMFRIATAFWASQAVYVAAKLGLADALAEGPKGSDEIASQLGANQAALARLVRVLVDLGVLATADDGRIGLTEVGAPLQSNTPGSLRSMVLTMGEEHYQAWGRLIDSVHSGRPAFDKVFGDPLFEYLESHPDANQTFNRAMGDFTSQVALAALLAYDFSGIQTVVDVGGGYGILLRGILRSIQSMFGIVFDSSQVIADTASDIEREGLAQRCRAVAGDFFQSVPSGADAYILKNVLHDWDDEHAIAILKNCRQAMRKDSKLLVLEVVLPVAEDPLFGGLLDLNMLVMSGGRERTEEQYRKLLEESGFRLTQAIRTVALVSILEGVPFV
jgi:SAM-dependent methyltransferase